MKRRSSLVLTSVFALLGIAVLASIATSGNPVVTVLAVIIWGAAFGAVPVCIQIWIFNAAPERFKIGSALIVNVFQIGIATGSLGGGILFDRSGITATFTSAACLAIACAIFVFIADRAQGTTKNSVRKPKL